MPKPNLKTIADYKKFCELFTKLSPADQHLIGRDMARTDLFFLLTVILKRKDLVHPWLLARCQEVQANPNGHLDLWSRAHGKSSIITMGLTIQDILSSHGDNPDPKWGGIEVTVGIFSCTRPLAKQFLAQIKREFESNEGLRGLFPDILWENPHKDAPSWSLDSGIIVMRLSNPKEATIEGHGLVDGMPTSKHFHILMYDDVVTIDSVRSTSMIEKTTQAWELSLNLGVEGGIYRYAGTRYHYADTYKIIMDRGSAIPRIYPATIDGTVEGDPVLLSRETIAQKRRDMGPYSFSCFPAGTPILMADFTEKNIEDIKAGDEVIGFSIGKGKGSKGKLIKTKVRATGGRMSPLIEATLASGRKVICTPDHKWYTGRNSSDHHNIYNKLGFKYHDLSGLVSVYDPRSLVNYDPLTAAYLAGIYDGEGSFSTTPSGASRVITISQSPEHNPEVFARIEVALQKLGFEYGKFFKEAGTSSTRKNKRGCMFSLKGGRRTAIRFINIIRPAKAYKIIEAYLKSSRSQYGDGYQSKDKLIDIQNLPAEPVYNIETETGNYIAWGYYTKNSQLLLNPTADNNQGFQRSWVEHYDSPEEHSKMNRYILIDPANEKKASNDYTVMLVVGLGPDENYYVIDMVRDRLSLTERAAVLFRLHRKYRPKGVGYEQYGMQADIAHMKDKMKRDNYNFKIVPLGGGLAKADRIKALIPIFEQHRMYLPNHCHKTNYEKKTEDLVEIFLTHEYDTFPVCEHDDMLDCLARILHVDDDWKVLWPLLEEDDGYIEPSSGSAWSA